ncbi:MAG: hypothetical protein L0Z62_00785 [Gemmataceae bacterium]|nr:hypothetical protein [Gemmataceae bacterium]
MRNTPTRIWSLLVVLALDAHAAQDPPDSSPLSPAERAAVRELVEKDLKGRGLFRGKVHLTRIEVVPDNHEGTPRRAIVTHYRYEGNLAILSSIDLDRRQVLEVEAVPHMPTALAPEERAEAEKLARAHVEVARALVRYRTLKVEVDALAITTADEKAFGYRHRLVRLRFRQGRDYLLYAPTVDVDLTTGQVRVYPAGKPHP